MTMLFSSERESSDDETGYYSNNSNMKVLYIKSYDRYDEGEMVLDSVSNLDDTKLIDLLNQILHVIHHPNRHELKKSVINLLKRSTNLVESDAIKQLNNIKPINDKLVWISRAYNTYEHTTIVNPSLTEDQLLKIVTRYPGDWYLQVEPPTDLQSVLNKYKNKKDRQLHAKARLKKERAIQKAKKLLKEARQIV